MCVEISSSSYSLENMKKISKDLKFHLEKFILIKNFKKKNYFSKNLENSSKSSINFKIPRTQIYKANSFISLQFKNFLFINSFKLIFNSRI